MENFIFYYTFFRDFDLALSKMTEDAGHAKKFIQIARKICELEAQTFLSNESKELLEMYQKEFFEYTKYFKDLHLTQDEWRLKAGLMCAFAEWCEETNFFTLCLEKQKFILPENPVDGYFEVVNR